MKLSLPLKLTIVGILLFAAVIIVFLLIAGTTQRNRTVRITPDGHLIAEVEGERYTLLYEDIQPYADNASSFAYNKIDGSDRRTYTITSADGKRIIRERLRAILKKTIPYTQIGSYVPFKMEITLPDGKTYYINKCFGVPDQVRSYEEIFSQGESIESLFMKYGVKTNSLPQDTKTAEEVEKESRKK